MIRLDQRSLLDQARPGNPRARERGEVSRALCQPWWEGIPSSEAVQPNLAKMSRSSPKRGTED